MQSLSISICFEVYDAFLQNIWFCFVFWREILGYLILPLNLIAVESEVQKEAHGSVLESDRSSPCGFFCYVLLCLMYS